MTIEQCSILIYYSEDEIIANAAWEEYKKIEGDFWKKFSKTAKTDKIKKEAEFLAKSFNT